MQRNVILYEGQRFIKAIVADDFATVTLQQWMRP